jgi:hypothetical protein
LNIPDKSHNFGDLIFIHGILDAYSKTSFEGQFSFSSAFFFNDYLAKPSFDQKRKKATYKLGTNSFLLGSLQTLNCTGYRASIF